MQFFRVLIDMHRHYSAAEAFQGLVLHDYEGFFEAMYGIKATAADGEVSRLYGE